MRSKSDSGKLIPASFPFATAHIAIVRQFSKRDLKTAQNAKALPFGAYDRSHRMPVSSDVNYKVNGATQARHLANLLYTLENSAGLCSRTDMGRHIFEARAAAKVVTVDSIFSTRGFTSNAHVPCSTALRLAMRDAG